MSSLYDDIGIGESDKAKGKYPLKKTNITFISSYLYFPGSGLQMGVFLENEVCTTMQSNAARDCSSNITVGVIAIPSPFTLFHKKLSSKYQFKDFLCNHYFIIKLDCKSS